jgi:hypothetical protein
MAPGLDNAVNTKTMAGYVNDNYDDLLYCDENEEDDEVDNILLTFSPTLGGISEDEQHLFVDDLDNPNHMMENPNKIVKFVDDEEKKMDAERDKERSRQELLSKIVRLTDLLMVAEKQLLTEKEKRKKKEKTLMKLAKELKRRMSQKDKDSDRIEEVRTDSAVLRVLSLEIASRAVSKPNRWASNFNDLFNFFA